MTHVPDQTTAEWESSIANLTLDNKDEVIDKISPQKEMSENHALAAIASDPDVDNCEADFISADLMTLDRKIEATRPLPPGEKSIEKVEPEADENSADWFCEGDEVSDDKIRVYVLIDDRYCGGLIGRGGRSIDEIRKAAGANICLQDRRLKFVNHLPKRALKIYGDEDSIQAAITATAHRLLEVKAANIAYRNNEEVAPVVNPTFEITLLSPEGLLSEEYRSHSHVVVENNDKWELIDIWGNEEVFPSLCLQIVKDCGLGKAEINETLLTTAVNRQYKRNNMSRNHSNNDRRSNGNRYNSYNNFDDDYQYNPPRDRNQYGMNSHRNHNQNNDRNGGYKRQGMNSSYPVNNGNDTGYKGTMHQSYHGQSQSYQAVPSVYNNVSAAPQAYLAPSQGVAYNTSYAQPKNLYDSNYNSYDAPQPQEDVWGSSQSNREPWHGLEVNRNSYAMYGQNPIGTASYFSQQRPSEPVNSYLGNQPGPGNAVTKSDVWEDV